MIMRNMVDQPNTTRENLVNDLQAVGTTAPKTPNTESCFAWVFFPLSDTQINL